MKGKSLLLVVDMITTWDFEGAEEMAPRAPTVVETINVLRRESGPDLRVAFANDLDGGFHGSRDKAFALAREGRHPELVEPLETEPGEDFIHKGQHSAFYGTPLAHLLDVEEIENLILTGQVTEQCILYTALDAHVRGYQVKVVTDAVLAMDTRLGNAALEMMERNMQARLMTSTDLLRA